MGQIVEARLNRTSSRAFFPLGRTALAAATISACVLTVAAQPAELTSLRAIHALTNSQASHQIPVAFEATVTYSRDYERTMFVQDGDFAIYVQPKVHMNLAAGDRVLIKGTTHESFKPFVTANSITLLEHGSLPKAAPATFDQLIRAEFDCRLVTVRGTVRNADIVMSSDVPSISLQMQTEGGGVDVVIDTANLDLFKDILDDQVDITGAASGRFDGKMQQTGVLLHVSSIAGMKVVKDAATNPWVLPITPMGEIIMTGYRIRNETQRVRVHGTITYYQPGAALVLQDGPTSLWVMTTSIAPLHVGDQADATGFPDVHDGFLALTNGEVQDRQVQAPVLPRPVTWSELSLSHHLFDLVSIDGQVIAETRGAAQDEYVLASNGNLFSAIYRHPPGRSLHPAPPPPMKHVPIGSKVRVTGICVMGASNPFDSQVPFDILLRETGDIVVVAGAPWLSVGNLVRVVGALLIAVFVFAAWGWTLRRKVRRQTEAMTAQAEAEAAVERHNSQLEHRRSRVLEDINSSRPLSELIEQIAEMVSFSLHGAQCWCEVADGARLGHIPPEARGLRIVRREIPARNGGSLGALFAGFNSPDTPGFEELDTLAAGVRLATLAIETRKLYKDLVYRSEFDLLTDIYNRFSLDRYLDEQIEIAREKGSIFGLVYIDLDEFKQVNDLYGHHVGDLYLQEVSLRMKRQLRSGDMLARLGGDEFAVLVPVVRSRADVEEIAQRLERCFDAPFSVEGYVLRGAASVGMALYPEDGSSVDSLLSSADAAMYVNKHTKRNASLPPRLQRVLFPPED